MCCAEDEKGDNAGEGAAAISVFIHLEPGCAYKGMRVERVQLLYKIDRSMHSHLFVQQMLVF